MQERLGTLVTFDKRQDEWHWLMRPEVAHALEQLGWVEDPVSLPGETQAHGPTTGKTLHSIVSEVNLRAKEHPIGELQEIRKDLKGKQKLQRCIFRVEDPKTTSEEWAFHYGGRTELQFNVGFERVNDIDELRYGVAFSLQTGKWLPKIDVLVPKVKLFNDFIQLYLDKYADMRMWWYYKGKRSSDYMPTSIPPELITEGVFVFLGKRQPVEQLDYEILLDDLDRLLPLYEYIEGSGTSQPISAARAAPFAFRPGCRVKRSATVASQAQRELDISLRHNDLQEALHRRLADEYGVENVGTELPSGVGTSVDVVVRREDGFWFYEIKTSHSPRACIRQALGQLLEYAFWPGSQEATRLVVVGETVLDEEGAEYLRALRKRFYLPLEYEQISLVG
jgi:hypothetical protein